MGEIIAFNVEKDFKHVSYIDDKGDLGVSTRCRSLAIYRLNKSEFEVVYGGGSFILNRDVLAEFLHVSSVFVDPEDKHKPDMDMVACDY